VILVDANLLIYAYHPRAEQPGLAARPRAAQLAVSATTLGPSSQQRRRGRMGITRSAVLKIIGNKSALGTRDQEQNKSQSAKVYLSEALRKFNQDGLYALSTGGQAGWMLVATPCRIQARIVAAQQRFKPAPALNRRGVRRAAFLS
jgi:hypothetical protein